MMEQSSTCLKNNRMEGRRQQCKQEKANETESRVQASRKPSRRKRSSPAERQVKMKVSAA
eukprot:3286871-Pleurochrysis_carterae.AAC.1